MIVSWRAACGGHKAWVITSASRPLAAKQLAYFSTMPKSALSELLKKKEPGHEENPGHPQVEH